MHSEIEDELINFKRVLASDVLFYDLNKPGIYAIFVDNENSLPEPFNSYLSKRKHKCIYVGKASKSLFLRLVEEDLYGKSHSTFFRSLGAVLGYRPPKGSLIGKKNQNNYKFNRKDTKEVVKWIEMHLGVSWIGMSTDKLKLEESRIIKKIRPLFNIKHNPDKLEELEKLRKECRDIATSIDQSNVY